MWPFKKPYRRPVCFEPSEQDLLLFAAERFAKAPVGIWSMESDGGESIFRDATLCFSPDLTGWVHFWALDYPPGNFRCKFVYQHAKDGLIRIASAEPEISRPIWFDLQYRFDVRTDNYGLRVLQIHIAPSDRSTSLGQWMGDEFDFIPHLDPKPPDW